MTQALRTEVISDPSDERLDDYRDLRSGDADGATRSGTDHVVIESHIALRCAMSGPLQLRSVLVTPSRATSQASLLRSVPAEVPVFVAEREVLARLTGFDVHRGVLASAVRPPATDPEEILSRCTRVAILESLTDLENVGAVFRVAAALGLEGVLLDNRCADPLYRRCVRVSLGWSTVIPHARTIDLRSGIRQVREAGHRVVALTPRSGAMAVDRAAAAGVLSDPVALLVGAEGDGLSDDALRAADHEVRIPMADGVDSLNAATALAVVGAFAAAQRGWDGR